MEIKLNDNKKSRCNDFKNISRVHKNLQLKNIKNQ